METQDLTIDEAMQDILAALNDAHAQLVPEGFKSVTEIWDASGRKITRKQMSNNLNIATEKSLMEKLLIGKYVYYRVKKK